jgi:hypothetical protein
VKRWEDVATRQTACRPKDQSEAIYIYTRKQAQGDSELHQNFAVYFFFSQTRTSDVGFTKQKRRSARSALPPIEI